MRKEQQNLRGNQQEILGLLERSRKKQNELQSGLEKLTSKIGKLEKGIRDELKSGRKRMDNIDNYIRERKIKNGYEKEKTDDLKKEVSEKASKDELQAEARGLEGKIDVLIDSTNKQNKLMKENSEQQKDQVEAMKDMNRNFLIVIGIIFTIFSILIGVIELFLRFG